MLRRRISEKKCSFFHRCVFYFVDESAEPIFDYLSEDGEIVALIKPQFEAGVRRLVRKVLSGRKHTSGSDRNGDQYALYRI